MSLFVREFKIRPLRWTELTWGRTITTSRAFLKGSVQSKQKNTQKLLCFSMAYTILIRYNVHIYLRSTFKKIVQFTSIYRGDDYRSDNIAILYHYITQFIISLHDKSLCGLAIIQ